MFNCSLIPKYEWSENISVTKVLNYRIYLTKRIVRMNNYIGYPTFQSCICLVGANIASHFCNIWWPCNIRPRILVAIRFCENKGKVLWFMVIDCVQWYLISFCRKDLPMRRILNTVENNVWIVLKGNIVIIMIGSSYIS